MKINEIFYSIQGEGFYTGSPAIFIRFSGCNLKCHACDTNHDALIEVGREEIINKISTIIPANIKPIIILTGGEPGLQVDGDLIKKLHRFGLVTIETNGTIDLSHLPDLWITLSPKPGIEIKQIYCNELKILYPGNNPLDYNYIECPVDKRYIQPLDIGNDLRENTRLAYEFVLSNPGWKLSQQTQKSGGFK